MVRPISLRLRSTEILNKARATLAQANEDAVLQRRTKLAGIKALVAVRKAYRLEEEASILFMSEAAQKRWRDRRTLVEQDLKRIAGLGH
jgi:hypothetical protein